MKEVSREERKGNREGWQEKGKKERVKGGEKSK